MCPIIQNDKNTFDNPLSSLGWTAVADAAGAATTEASLSHNATAGNPGGALEIFGSNPDNGVGKAYIFDYVPFASSGYDHETHLESWEETVMAANRNYKPGQFTTFIGYEFTAGTEVEGGNLHRNVIFESSKAPIRPWSREDSLNQWIFGLGWIS